MVASLMVSLFSLETHQPAEFPLNQLFPLADATSPISSNIGGSFLPFQRWMKFKEAFSPNFVLEALRSCSKPPATCLDPFGGSGTTALTCSLLGVATHTVEVNPFLADLIRAKTSFPNTRRLRELTKQVFEYTKDVPCHFDITAAEWPNSLCEPGVDGRFVFYEDVLCHILGLREAIDAVSTNKHKVLMRACLGAILLPLSNVVVNGKGRRYRGNWRERRIDKAQVYHLFETAMNRACEDIDLFESSHHSMCHVETGDCREVRLQQDYFDLVVFSPPYPNSFDYTDVYNLELWVLGYLHDRATNKNLRRSTLQSHVQVDRSWSASKSDTPSATKVYQALADRRGQLWDRRIPEMIRAYFQDMRLVFGRLAKALKRGGRMIIVVGDSQYAGVRIDVSELFIEDAAAAGFKLQKAEHIRSMRNSAQHGGARELSEKVLTFDLA